MRTHRPAKVVATLAALAASCATAGTAQARNADLDFTPAKSPVVHIHEAIQVDSGTSTEWAFPKAPAGCRAYRQVVKLTRAQRKAHVEPIVMQTYFCSKTLPV